MYSAFSSSRFIYGKAQLRTLLSQRFFGKHTLTGTCILNNQTRFFTSRGFSNERQFHVIADEAMDQLVEEFSGLEEAISGNINDFDCEYASGVLTLKLGPHGTYVINKQPPNKQIWLSSPQSGPKRFDFDHEQKSWYSARDGTTLDGLLTQELSQLLKFGIAMSMCKTYSTKLAFAKGFRKITRSFLQERHASYAVNVFLLQDVPKLGRAGEEVEVKPGYARNFLVRFGKALYMGSDEYRKNLPVISSNLDTSRKWTSSSIKETINQLYAMDVQTAEEYLRSSQKAMTISNPDSVIVEPCVDI